MRFHPVLLMSAACFGLLLLSFVLIQIPLVNILAVLLLAPFWFGVAVQLSMLATAILAFRGSIERGWLFLPLVFWGGSVGLSLASAERAEAAAASTEAANASVSWRAPRPFEYRAIDRGSVGYSEIVERFRDTRAYFVGEKETTVRYFAKDAGCDNASKGFYYDRRFDEPFLYRADIFRSYQGADKTKQCILSLSLPERKQPSYAVENSRSPVKGDWINPRLGERFTVTNSATGHVLATVETATIDVVSPIILFQVTCKKGGFSTPAEECGVWPSYRNKVVAAGYKPRTDRGNPFIPTADPMNSRVGALGRAIGLQPRLPTD